MLLPNTHKAFLMLFTNKPFFNLPNIYFQNDLLSWTDRVKYPGVIIDSKLKFYCHSDLIMGKVFAPFIKVFAPKGDTQKPKDLFGCVYCS